jgi:hypothetical protein
MTRIYVSTVIDATPAEVWAAVEPVEQHVEWMADAREIRFDGEQRRGVGTRFDCDTRLGPLKVTDRMEIDEWRPNEAMGVRHAGIIRGRGRFTLHRAVGRGTLFAWEEDLQFPWWLGGPAGALAAAPILRGVWRRNLRTLKALVESR